MPFTMVWLEPGRSAEPPIISGMAGISASSAAPEWTRVAAAGRSAAALAMCSSSAAKAAAGRSPRVTRSNAARCSLPFSRPAQRRRAPRPRAPAFFPALATSAGISEGGGGPADRLAGGGDLLVEQSIAVAVLVALERPRALVDQRLAGDEARPVLAARPAQRAGDLAVVVPVDPPGRPAGRLEAHDLVAGLGQAGATVDGGVVVVEEHGELGELQAAGQVRRFVADTLHQAAVAGDYPGAVVDQPGAIAGGQAALGHRHADRGGEALP